MLIKNVLIANTLKVLNIIRNNFKEILLSSSKIVQNGNTSSLEFISNDVKYYYQLCTMVGLRQMIQSPFRATCTISTLIRHILARVSSKISLKGIINTEISDHQLVFCTRKISKYVMLKIYKIPSINKTIPLIVLKMH